MGESRSLCQSNLIEKIYAPELKVKEHVRALISSMRALRDVPTEYFRKSYFIQKPQIDPRESITSLEDILREGRRIHPEMKVAKLFKTIHGSKIVSMCLTQWKIAFIQNWIRKDMGILQRYRLGKAALEAIRTYLKERKSNMQELQLKREYLLKARCIKAWKTFEHFPVKQFRARRIFETWKSLHLHTKQERANNKTALHFRDRLLKQKVMYILYKFSQCRMIPKKNYQRSLKTRAMFSLILFHKKVKILTKVVHSQLSVEKLKQRDLDRLAVGFYTWKQQITDAKNIEREKQLLYVALKFRANSLCKKTLKLWHRRSVLTQNLQKAEKIVTRTVLGFSFFCVKQYAESIEDSCLVESTQSVKDLYAEYQTDKLKNKLVTIFKKKQLFCQWKDIALSKRIDFPYNYYNQRLAEKCFKRFMYFLRQRWVKQKYQIM